MIRRINSRRVLYIVFSLLLPLSVSMGLGAAESDLRHDDVERMTPRQLSDRAETYIQEMGSMLGQVLNMLEDARGEKDVLKLNCVNEKLTQLRGLVVVSEQSQVLMQENLARQEMEEARHEFTKILVARDRVRQLRAEAEECIGQLAFVVDEEIIVEAEIPQDLPDVLTGAPVIAPASVRPPMASPVD